MKYSMPDALQDQAELDQFVRLVQAEGVRSYLEIGSKFGGSLQPITRAMQKYSRVVSVDLEGRAELKAAVSTLQKVDEYEVHLIVGDSTDPRVIADVHALGPYDLCLIDANHTEPFVRCDWANYGPMARIVAFHDIAWNQGDRPDKPWKIEVPTVWNEIKGKYRYQEIKLCHTRRDNGIGILWR